MVSHMKRVAASPKIFSSKKAKVVSRPTFSTKKLSMLFAAILEKEGTKLIRQQVLDKIIEEMKECNIEIDESYKLSISRRFTDIKNTLVNIGMVGEHKTSLASCNVEYFYVQDNPEELEKLQIRHQTLKHKQNQLFKQWRKLQTRRIQLKIQSMKDSSSIPFVKEIDGHETMHSICLQRESKYEHRSEMLGRKSIPAKLIPASINNSNLKECRILDSISIFDFSVLEQMESILNENHFEGIFPSFLSSISA